MNKTIDVNMVKPHIEIERISGKKETIKVKTGYLIPVIAKAIVRDNRVLSLSIVDNGIKYQLMDEQKDRCMNTLDAWGDHRLIF